jgi:hypothetical protein
MGFVKKIAQLEKPGFLRYHLKMHKMTAEKALLRPKKNAPKNLLKKNCG